MGAVKNHFFDEINAATCWACEELLADCACGDRFSDMCESEPPLSADERYQAAARQKQKLRR